ncbi:flagellar basal-body rod protein FlgG [Thermanaeromonas toyohensis ToBE]|uniref:Flagellar basal-body rod protein FlgG n=1 Tax=Thermanaeromonas toyohensis ToBE TaxID=698762 RepID=A0A1W1VU11_9FIRM|nr:flagellar hook-basal body protein [Thermanaeromonas toyohensis]SMB96601.1 flagellar basal-body rod protein FlgG [Thermanaeromonas toyohensis ToBE]
MLKGFYTSACGLMTGLRRLDVVADNAANLNTPGFLRRRYAIQAGFGRALEAVAGGYSAPVGTARPVVVVTDVPCAAGPGELKHTGRPLDVAAEDGLFFAVMQGGNVFYTRNGHFQVLPNGVLADAAGRPVLGTDGNPVVVGREDFLVLPDGTVTAPDGVTLGQLGLWRVENPVPAGGGLYQGLAVTATGRVRQGWLCGPNTSLAQESVELVAVQRAFESAQRVLVAEDQALGSLISAVRA